MRKRQAPRPIRRAVHRRAHELALEKYRELVDLLLAELEAGRVQPASVAAWSPPGASAEQPARWAREKGREVVGDESSPTTPRVLTQSEPAVASSSTAS